MDVQLAQPVFRLKAGATSCTILQLMQTDLQEFEQQLGVTVAQAPDFFAGVPVVIDLEKLLPEMTPDFSALKAMMLQKGMVPVGIRHGSEAQREAAHRSGLAALSAGKTSAASGQNGTRAESQRPMSRLVTSPVRSGTQIYARDADLVVVASVSPGAELLADGHIHVYGPLRGRALAGVQGNRDARIFCTSLFAELVSIAGFYLTREDMQSLPENHGMIQVYLEGEQVRIEPVAQSHFA